MTEPAASATTEWTDDDVREIVLTLIKDLAPDSDTELKADTKLVEDLGYHSLALMEVAFALEDEFDLEPIDEETARKITTVGNVQDLVLEKLAEQS
ncbi:acyl carrier protein [Amycolatopsis minnesotensis]|uniref:Carrier domain-containing protein n=1 Tax=Amycolatopsis minnesotensis TaxID=337894 RepID=A0ABN2QL39_9PSEU